MNPTRLGASVPGSSVGATADTQNHISLTYVNPSRALRDPRLSAKAKGLYAFIADASNRFGITADEIARSMRDGRSAILAGLTELEKHGYLIRHQPRNPDGTLGVGAYEITGGRV